MCQLQDLEMMAEKNSFLAKLWQIRKRIPRWVRNRTYLIKHETAVKVGVRQRVKVTEAHLNLKAGDMIRVRCREEILLTLDGWKRHKGCTFMDEMWQFCGREYKVWKKVACILDERDMKLKKCRDTVILEGLTCQGSWPFKECDRCCFFFWKEVWLERGSRVSNEGQANPA